MLELANSLRADPERPAFHVMPRHGWINDPNGPVHYDGRYHLYVPSQKPFLMALLLKLASTCLHTIRERRSRGYFFSYLTIRLLA